MAITYNRSTDLLYICFDPDAKQVVCQDLSADVVLELGEGDRTVGLEVLDASKRIDLGALPDTRYAEIA